VASFATSLFATVATFHSVAEADVLLGWLVGVPRRWQRGMMIPAVYGLVRTRPYGDNAHVSRRFLQ